MVYGKTNVLFPDHEEIFAWERILGDERLIVVNNFTENTVTVDLREVVDREEFTLYLSNYKDFKMSESGSYQLRAYESFVLFNESSELL